MVKSEDSGSRLPRLNPGSCRCENSINLLLWAPVTSPVKWAYREYLPVKVIVKIKRAGFLKLL